MSAQAESILGQDGKGAVASFFDTLVGTIMVILMGVGLVTLTLAWRTSDVEFKSGGVLRVTQSTWWGFQKEVTNISAAVPEGWTIERDNGDRVPLTSQSIRLRN